jgi:hypothetical protein
VGFFSVRGKVAFRLCRDCPLGADCDLSGTTEEELPAREGFWRGEAEELTFYICSNPEDCKGGVNSSCRANHIGVLCAICEEEHFKDTTGACLPCGDLTQAWINFGIFSAVIVFALLFQFWLVLRAGQLLMAQSKFDADREEEGETDFDIYDTQTTTSGTLPPHTAPPPPPNMLFKLKIALGFLQIMTSLTYSVEIPWPRGYRKFTSYLNIISFDFVSITRLECVFETNYYRKFLIMTLVPIITFTLTYIFYLLPKNLGYCCKSSSPAAAKRSRVRFWRMFIFTLFLIYPVVSATVCRLFVCREIEGKRFLASDLTISCDSTTYKTFAFYASFMLLVYPLGIPLFVFVKMLRLRHKLKKPNVKAQFGFLYLGFFTQYWWFEFIDMFHKLIQTSLLAFLPKVWQLRGGLAVTVFYMLCILIVRPYLRKGDDRLHLLAQTEIFLFFLSAYIFNLDSEFDPVLDVFLTVTFICLVCGFFGFLIPQILTIVIKQAVTKYECIGRRCEKCSKKVKKWRDASKVRKMTMAEMNEARALRRRKRDDTDDVKLVRNPLYHPTMQGGHTTDKIGELFLMANPLFDTGGGDAGSAGAYAPDVAALEGRVINPEDLRVNDWDDDDISSGDLSGDNSEQMADLEAVEWSATSSDSDDNDAAADAGDADGAAAAADDEEGKEAVDPAAAAAAKKAKLAAMDPEKLRELRKKKATKAALAALETETVSMDFDDLDDTDDDDDDAGFDINMDNDDDDDDDMMSAAKPASRPRRGTRRARDID